MNILIKPRKNRYIIYAIIIALFSTIGMQISLLHTNIGKVLEKIEYDSVWNHMQTVDKAGAGDNLQHHFSIKNNFSFISRKIV